MKKVYELFPELSGIVAATAEQSIQGLNLALESDPDGVSEHEAVSIEAGLRVTAVRRQVGTFLYIPLESELAFLTGGNSLRIKFGTRTGDDANLQYAAIAVIRQLQTNGIAATWDATSNSVMIQI